MQHNLTPHPCGKAASSEKPLLGQALGKAPLVPLQVGDPGDSPGWRCPGEAGGICGGWAAGGVSISALLLAR